MHNVFTFVHVVLIKLRTFKFEFQTMKITKPYSMLQLIKKPLSHFLYFPRNCYHEFPTKLIPCLFQPFIWACVWTKTNSRGSPFIREMFVCLTLYFFKQNMKYQYSYRKVHFTIFMAYFSDRLKRIWTSQKKINFYIECGMHRENQMKRSENWISSNVIDQKWDSAIFEFHSWLYFLINNRK